MNAEVFTIAASYHLNKNNCKEHNESKKNEIKRQRKRESKMSGTES